MTESTRQVVARRRRTGDLTEDEIIIMAGRGTFSVSMYRYGAEKLRKLTRRMCRDGKLKLICIDRGVIYYRAK